MPKKKVVKKKVGKTIEEAKGWLLPKKAPISEEEKERLAKEKERLEEVRKRNIRVCQLVSGGLLEAAGNLRRLRWALDGCISEETRVYLDKTGAELLRRSMHAELEAFALRKPEEREEGHSMWQQVRPPNEAEFALAFAGKK